MGGQYYIDRLQTDTANCRRAALTAPISGRAAPCNSTAMPDEEKSIDDGEARRNPNAGRQLTPLRKLGYRLGAPLLSGFARLLWSTCRVEVIRGEEIIARIIEDDLPYLPCYWHRDIFVCLMTIRSWIRRGFKAGVIISASVDGEVPAAIARAWGAEVVRGSATRTGALAMRDMHQLMKGGVSIITAADGPVGPAYYFKPGVILAARIGSAHLLPISCAASRAWQFDTWDDFVLPKPFAKIALAIGEPIEVPRRASQDEQEELRIRLQDAVNSLHEESKQVFG